MRRARSIYPSGVEENLGATRVPCLKLASNKPLALQIEQHVLPQQVGLQVADDALVVSFFFVNVCV